MTARDWSFRVFHDGDCPLCAREVALLRRLDRRGRIDFVDIADPDFRAQDYGATWAELMARIRGQLPDGTWVEGVEVFRRLYGAVGFGPVVWLTRMPGLSHVLDFAYDQFAARRLRLTGRCDAACPLPPPRSA